MSTARMTAHRGVGVSLRGLPNDGFTEVWLTCSAAEVAGRPPQEYFADAAKLLSRRGVQPILEKVYGPLSARETLHRIRAEAWVDHGLDPDLPFTFIEGAPPDGGEFSGLQVWGIAPVDRDEIAVRTVRAGTVPARLWTGPGFRMLYLPQVRGNGLDGPLPAGVGAQAECMFVNAEAALRAQDFGWAGVVRTWIYLARLLDGYGDLNRVRTAHFAREGLGENARAGFFPASTGIQGRSLDEECFLSLLAVDGARARGFGVAPIAGSVRQPHAFSYGSAFSRGMTLSCGGRRTIHVSGTASIDSRGRTVHVGDAEAQSVETLLCIAALLEEQGASLDRISTATLFCKNREAHEAYRNVVRLLRIPEFPTLPVLADVCRPDLLVEIEAVATL